MFNIIRKKAAFRKTNTAVQNKAAENAMLINAADGTVDFILDETTRELHGALVRWQDLVRTETLLTRIGG